MTTPQPILSVRIPGYAEPKFHLDQTVWALELYRQKVATDCEICAGKGKLAVAGTDLLAFCPAAGCVAGRVQSKTETQFASIRASKIGRVGISAAAANPDRKQDVTVEIRYMLYATGVGSGRIWDEEHLFASREEAQAAALDAGAVLDGDRRAAEEERARW